MLLRSRMLTPLDARALFTLTPPTHAAGYPTWLRIVIEVEDHGEGSEISCRQAVFAVCRREINSERSFEVMLNVVD
jgi:hypothetical protein